MSSSTTPRNVHVVPWRMPSARGVLLAGTLLALLMTVGGWLTLQSTVALRVEAEQVVHTQNVINALHDVMEELLNAETGQRGFIITGDAAHRAPYDQALPKIGEAIGRVSALTGDNPEQQAAVGRLRVQIDLRLSELAHNLALRTESGLEAAAARVATGHGLAVMQAVRAENDAIEATERRLLALRKAQADRQFIVATGGQVALALLSLLMLWAFARTVRSNLRARAATAEAIHREREHLRVTLTSIGDGVITADRDGRVTMMNHVAEALTGWTTAEAAGQPLADVFRVLNETSRVPVASPVDRAISQGQVVGLATHTVLVARDGIERPIADSAAPIRDEDGRAIGAVLVFRNVEKERAAERAMSEAFEYSRAIVDAVREPLLVVTSDFTVRSASRSFYTTFQTTPAATEGRSVFEVAGGAWRTPEFRRWLDHAFSTRQPVETLEIPTELPDNGSGMLRLHASHLGHDTNVGGLLLVAVEDISDERAADAARAGMLAKQTAWSARLQQVAAASLTIHSATTQDSVVGIIGAEARRILGAGDCTVVFEPEPADEETGALIVPLMGRETQLGYIRCRDKTPGAFDADDRAILTQLAHMASTAVENARLYGEMRQADVRKDEFLATLAHELRNPLAPIHHALQLMRRSTDPEEQRTNREVIERQVRQLVHLVDDLLDVSRVSRGKLDLRRRRVTLAEVLGSSIETSRPLVEAKGHTLTLTLPPQPVWLMADLTRLAQVFSNLLNNSAKYTEPGGQIVVSAEMTGADVQITVRDTGIGISPDMLPHVFDVFRQAANAGEHAQGGLGIGLTLVRRIVELHGGRVDAKSPGLGQGSEFVVHLPADATPSLKATMTETPSTPDPGGSRLRVLVVDDNEDSADTLATLLRMAGHDVDVARDGLGAVDRTASFDPDLVLLDIGLPGINGYEAARRIRQLPRGAAVQLVALTGWGQEDDRRRSREAGFDQHLVKPVDFDALRTLLASLRPRS